MKVYLLEDVKSKGKKGEIIEVSEGYARNFLIPRKIAKKVDANVLNEIANRESSEKFRQQQEQKEAETIFNKIDKKTFSIKAKSGTGDKLFGSVTSREIAAAISAASGFEIDRRKIQLDEDIKKLGKYNVEVKIYTDIVANIIVSVE
ncbi:MAG: 50S ribosomal protein L9 [Ruminococcaceae bacterium]|nr:50S ribosomal protein L9 [Oscillospiraceae bacterium]